MKKDLVGVQVLAMLLVLPQAALAGNAFVTAYWGNQSTGEGIAKDRAEAFVNEDSKRWKRFEFTSETEGFGDAAAAPFGDKVEYKINAVNYNLFIGDDRSIPFQLYLADLSSKEKPEEENKLKLLDPTQGFSIQFPFGAMYKGSDGGLCRFKNLKGYCIVGGDLTVRGVKLNETDDAGKVTDSTIYGASAGIRAAAQLPIFQKVPGSDQAGHLGISIGARYYYHNTNKQDLLFEKLADPNGNPIEFKKGFGAVTAESEFDVYNHFKIRLEYFKPLNNRDVLDDVFKASIVVEPAKTK